MDSSVGAAFQQSRVFETQMREQGTCSVLNTAVALSGAAGAQFGKMTRQLHVLAHGQKGQQVELLKDIARVIHPKPVARSSTQLV